MWWWNLEKNWNCMRCIQFNVENYNCSTHQYENKKTNYKGICVVDTFVRMWNVDNNHQKYDKIAIVWNVGYRKMMKISWREKKTNEEVLKLADEQLYITSTIKKREIIYFGHMIRRNNIHMLLLEGPLEGKEAEEGQERSGWQISQNGRECDTKTPWDLLKIGSHGGSWQPTFLKKTAPDDDDLDWSSWYMWFLFLELTQNAAIDSKIINIFLKKLCKVLQKKTRLFQIST